jgi:hypothetical protein
MNTLTRSLGYRSNWMLSVTFVLGVLLMAGTWIALYWEESLFNESHLVGYYCCVTEQDLPDPGTLERTLSDFFRTSPGRHLPSLIFVGANAGLFAVRIRRGRGTGWWLPFLFVALWGAFLVTLWGLTGKLLPKPQASKEPDGSQCGGPTSCCRTIYHSIER